MIFELVYDAAGEFLFANHAFGHGPARSDSSP
jgi:hypothetical protein